MQRDCHGKNRVGLKKGRLAAPSVTWIPSLAGHGATQQGPGDKSSSRSRMGGSAQSCNHPERALGSNPVLVFGSLAHRAWFTPRSDIDLCVDGIPVDKFFHAEAEVEALASVFKVDLVDSRECFPELLKQVEEEGVEL